MRLMTLMWRSAAQARLVLLGSMGIFFLFQIFLIANAAEIERSNAFSRISELVPGFLQRGLGAQAMQLATFKGAVAFGYFHPVIVCAVSLIAVYVATEPAHEIEAGLVDLTLARSVPRHRLMTRSMVLTVLTVVAITVLMLAGTYVGLQWLASGFAWPAPGTIAILAVHLVAVALCSGAVGLLAAACCRRWTTAFTIGAAVVVVGYLIDFLAIGWPPARTLAWAFPFNYYPALVLLAGNSNIPRDLSVLVAATTVFTALAYWKFERRDL